MKFLWSLALFESEDVVIPDLCLSADLHRTNCPEGARQSSADSEIGLRGRECWTPSNPLGVLEPLKPLLESPGAFGPPGASGILLNWKL